jgi:hypothetical protein
MMLPMNLQAPVRRSASVNVTSRLANSSGPQGEVLALPCLFEARDGSQAQGVSVTADTISSLCVFGFYADMSVQGVAELALGEASGVPQVRGGGCGGM